MKKLNKVFVVLLFAVAIMLLLTVNASAAVDSSLVTDEVKTITFDAEYYLNSYSDLKAAYGNDEEAAYAHFLAFGIGEGRCAKLTFDVGYYLNSYEDLQNAFEEDYEAAYKHFIEFGAAEGRSGCPIYDASYYVENNKDVKDAYGDNGLKAYEHYVVFGIEEGRQACEQFNVKCYLNKYKDLKDAFTSTGYAEGFEHFLVFGVDEGRVGTHEYETTTVDVTCTEDGYTLQECACGDTIRTVIPKLGHNYGVTEEVTAEDTEAGSNVHKHTCERCGEVEYFDEAHNYGEEPVSTTATCTEAGEETYVCSACGKEEVKSVEAYGHNYVLNEGERLTGTTAATCSEDGFDEYVCSECNTIRLVPVKATGKHDLTKVEAKEATCTEAGNKEYYKCTVCDKYFEDAEGTTEIVDKESVVIAAAHKMEVVPAKEATCSETGNNEYYKCTICGEVFKDELGTQATTVEAETIPAKGHTWEAGDPANYGLTAPTCTEDGYTVQVCSTCHDVEITAAEASHTMTKVEAKEPTTTSLGNNEYYTCSVCNGVFKDEAGTQPTTVEAETISTLTVDNLADLKAVISSGPITTVVLGADITGIAERINVSKTMTIEGNEHKLQFNTISKDESGVASALVILADNTVVNNLAVEMTAQDEWQGNYAIQVYDAEGVTLNNITASNGDAGILVNASNVKLTGTITLNDNEFGGIEVSKGTADGLNPSTLDISGATIINEDEQFRVPTIWIDGENDGNVVIGADYMFDTTELAEDQIQYYLNEKYSHFPTIVPPESGTGEDDEEEQQPVIPDDEEEQVTPNPDQGDEGTDVMEPVD